MMERLRRRVRGPFGDVRRAAIFVVLLIKNIGVPLPVPSDLNLITGGVQAARGSFSLMELILALEVAVLVGGGKAHLKR